MKIIKTLFMPLAKSFPILSETSALGDKNTEKKGAMEKEKLNKTDYSSNCQYFNLRLLFYYLFCRIIFLVPWFYSTFFICYLNITNWSELIVIETVIITISPLFFFFFFNHHSHHTISSLDPLCYFPRPLTHSRSYSLQVSHTANVTFICN